MKSCVPIKRARGLGHRARIELARDMPDMPAIQRRRRAAAEDAIFIVTRHRREPRVEIGRRHRRFEHRNRRGPQMRIQRIAHLVGRKLLHQIEMRDLSARMHAGIGAARAGHA